MDDPSFTCPGCGAVADLSADKCPYCQNPFFPAIGTSAAGLSSTEADLRKKITQLESKVAKAPGDGTSHFALGEAYHHLGDYQKARQHLEKAAELLPKKAEVFYMLAWNFGVSQGWESLPVVDNAKKALALNPKFKQAEALLHLNRGMQSYLFARSGHNPAALKEFEATMSLDPKNSYGFYFAGCVHELEGDLDRAAECMKTAAALSIDDIAPSREDARLFARLGVLYQKLGETDSAKKYLTDAVRLDPDNTAAQELLESLDG